jgi:hypothetical protein
MARRGPELSKDGLRPTVKLLKRAKYLLSRCLKFFFFIFFFFAFYV